MKETVKFINKGKFKPMTDSQLVMNWRGTFAFVIQNYRHLPRQILLKVQIYSHNKEIKHYPRLRSEIFGQK